MFRARMPLGGHGQQKSTATTFNSQGVVRESLVFPQILKLHAKQIWDNARHEDTPAPPGRRPVALWAGREKFPGGFA
jgi:hypothetical protein